MIEAELAPEVAEKTALAPSMTSSSCLGAFETQNTFDWHDENEYDQKKNKAWKRKSDGRLDFKEKKVGV